MAVSFVTSGCLYLNGAHCSRILSKSKQVKLKSFPTGPSSKCSSPVVCKVANDAEIQRLIIPESKDWFAANEEKLRSIPLWIGGGGAVALLANRTFSGISAVADASSAQSRTDVLCLAMAAALVLTGLQWLALKEKPPTSVELYGESVMFVNPSVPGGVAAEVEWCWQALSASSLCGSLVVIWDSKRILQAGVAPMQMELDPKAPDLGDICTKCMEEGKGRFLANMTLFPGRKEFQPFMPINTQGVLVQPIGDRGVLVAGTGTVRGFSQLDQAWISALSDKLEVTLESWNPDVKSV